MKLEQLRLAGATEIFESYSNTGSRCRFVKNKPEVETPDLRVLKPDKRILQPRWGILKPVPEAKTEILTTGPQKKQNSQT